MDNDFAGGCGEFAVDTQQTICVMVIFLATCSLLAIEMQKKLIENREILFSHINTFKWVFFIIFCHSLLKLLFAHGWFFLTKQTSTKLQNSVTFPISFWLEISIARRSFHLNSGNSIRAQLSRLCHSSKYMCVCRQTMLLFVENVDDKYTGFCKQVSILVFFFLLCTIQDDVHKLSGAVGD